MALQHTHKTTPFQAKKFPLVIICERLASPANVGALFRISEAFGVSEIIFSDASINFNSSRLKKTARNTHKEVPYRVSEDIISDIKHLKNKAFTVLALEITQTSTPLRDYPKNSSEKIALIIGNENSGVSERMLQIADHCVHIPMHGNNSSMNVIQATAIALYSLT